MVPATAMPPSGLQTEHAGGFGPCAASQGEVNDAAPTAHLLPSPTPHTRTHHSLAATRQWDYFKLN